MSCTRESGGCGGDGTGTLTLSGVDRERDGGLPLLARPDAGPPTRRPTLPCSSTAPRGRAPTSGPPAQNCWQLAPNNFVNSQAYFADVTSLVSGNGSYSLANFVKSGGAVNVNGASLVVLYDDGNPTNDRDIVIFDGNDSTEATSFDAERLDGHAARHQLQRRLGEPGPACVRRAVRAAFDDSALFVNSTQIVAQGPIFSGNTVPNAAAAPVATCSGTSSPDRHHEPVRGRSQTRCSSPAPRF